MERTTRHAPRRAALRRLSLQAVQLAAMVLSNAPQVGAVQELLDDGVKVDSYRVTERFAHDETSFTQGLEFDEAGLVLEGTGLYGKSQLLRVDYRTGEVKQRHTLPPELFGEGITVVGEELVQLTWKENLALLYDKTTLAPKGSFPYPYEGWGATAVGGTLLTTDGSHVVREWARAGAAWEERRSFPLVGADGAEVREVLWALDGRVVRIRVRLNELEEVNGEVWANMWPTETLVRFDPTSGRLLGWVDLRGLRAEAQAAGRSGRIDVLNGIAHRPASGSKAETLLVTGKWWAKAFALQIVDPETCSGGESCARRGAPRKGKAAARAGWASAGEVLALPAAAMQKFPLADFGN